MFSQNDPNKIVESLKILGIDKVDNPDLVLDEIAKYIFDVSEQTGSSSKKKTFDINYDYKFYFSDFLKYGINLNKEDIDWWEFNRILDAILLDDNSNMSKVMSYRLYEKPPKNIKTQENIRHQNMLKLKRKYSLPIKNEKGIEKLWGYLEQKAGENKE